MVTHFNRCSYVKTFHARTLKPVLESVVNFLLVTQDFDLVVTVNS